MKSNLVDNDIIIVGGGMVGAALALGLARDDFSIRLLEPKPPEYISGSGYEPRVSAISRATADFLKNLGAWDFITANRISPYRMMHIWEESSDAAVVFDSAEVQQPDLGNIIENELIRQSLFNQLQKYSNVVIEREVDIAWTDFSPSRARIGKKSGKVLSAQLVVGADGANSRVRQWVGIELKKNPTGHHALVANIKVKNSHQKAAWQKFLNTGPLALLPLADGGISIVWSTDKEDAQRLKGLNDEDFLKEINQQIADAPPAPVMTVGKRLVFPLVERHARVYHRNNVVLVGDAAHTIHPLAGQGVNLGFADARDLLKIISRNRQDLGEEYLLAKYERHRRLDNELMQKSMWVFKELFGSSNCLVRELRAFGMKIFAGSTMAKNFTMQRAMGE